MNTDDKILKQSQFVALALNNSITDNVKIAAEWYNSQKDHNKANNQDLINRFRGWIEIEERSE